MNATKPTISVLNSWQDNNQSLALKITLTNCIRMSLLSWAAFFLIEQCLISNNKNPQTLKEKIEMLQIQTNSIK